MLTHSIPLEHPADRYGASQPDEIHAYRIDPPIPATAFDWVAVRSGFDGDGPMGRGPTRWAAIEDLWDQEQQA